MWCLHSEKREIHLKGFLCFATTTTASLNLCGLKPNDTVNVSGTIQLGPDQKNAIGTIAPTSSLVNDDGCTATPLIVTFATPVTGCSSSVTATLSLNINHETCVSTVSVTCCSQPFSQPCQQCGSNLIGAEGVSILGVTADLRFYNYSACSATLNTITILLGNGTTTPGVFVGPVVLGPGLTPLQITFAGTNPVAFQYTVTPSSICTPPLCSSYAGVFRSGILIG